MIAEALEFLKERFAAAEEPREIEIDGRIYYDRTLTPFEKPKPDTVEISTLSAIAELLRIKVGGLAVPDVIIRVDSPVLVRLCSNSVDEWGNRYFYAKAAPQLPAPFKWGEYVEHEAFMIALQAIFLPSIDRDYLINVASLVTNEVVAQADDNGIAQKVALRSGVAVRESAELRPIVRLKPYRTFYDVDQPESQFLFRVKQFGPGQFPKLTLIEADGGAWKIGAMQNIAFFLKDAIAKMGPDTAATPIVS